jgi:hypothetical protein|tara:strand:+ start:349 stop:687 length:339 start_codon:yes stop_codon:yes gene_type:complete
MTKSVTNEDWELIYDDLGKIPHQGDYLIGIKSGDKMILEAEDHYISVGSENDLRLIASVPELLKIYKVARYLVSDGLKRAIDKDCFHDFLRGGIDWLDSAIDKFDRKQEELK